MSHAYVSGLGAVSCVGVGHDSLWRAVCEQTSGIKNGVGTVSENLHSLKTDLLHSDRALNLALLALNEALSQSGWSELTDEDGLILATTTGCISTWEKPLFRFLSQEISSEEFQSAFRSQPLGSLREFLSESLGFKGKSCLLSTACTAGTQALGLASQWVRDQRVRRCLVGGVDVLCDLTLSGFKSLSLLSEECSRPFDRRRQGINLSEGAAFICIESAPARGKNVWGEISGWGSASDAYHMTAPHPEGRESFMAMNQALKDASVTSDQIDWVHAHGTGSLHNDLSESRAINFLFQKHQPWVSSTKGIHGHALGASGVIESIVCFHALRDGKIPPTYGLEEPDELGLRHPQGVERMKLNHILKSSLGFGGSNAALVLSRVGG